MSSVVSLGSVALWQAIGLPAGKSVTRPWSCVLTTIFVLDFEKISKSLFFSIRTTFTSAKIFARPFEQKEVVLQHPAFSWSEGNTLHIRKCGPKC